MSSIITEGAVTELLIVVVTAVLGILFMRIAKTKPFSLRRLPALDALEEIVGRCTEMNKPLFSAGFTGGFTAATLAGMALTSYATELAAKSKTKVVAIVGYPEMIPMLRDVLRVEYEAAGAIDAYDPLDQVRYYGHLPDTKYSSGIAAAMERERPGGILLVGAWMLPSHVLIPGAVSADIGCMAIGGASAVQYGPAVAVTCDYMLLGEECAAVGAYVSKDPSLMANIVTQDVFRIFFSVLLIAGLFLSAFGSKLLVDLITL